MKSLILLTLIFLAAVWLDNHLPGPGPVETRMHP